MNSCERVLLALSHQQPDRVPIDFTCTPETESILKRHFRTNDTDVVREHLGVDIVHIKPRYIGPPLVTYDDGSFVDFWGVIRKPVPHGFGHYDEICHYPLSWVKSVSDLNLCTWPGPDWFDYNSLNELIGSHPGKAFSISNMNVFESTWYMRGLDQIMIDMVESPELADELLGRTGDFLCKYIQRSLEAAKGRIHIGHCADDLATQRGLLISPAMYRRFLQPHHSRLAKIIHGFGAKVFFHSCGAVTDLIPDLINSGIDILNPLQFDADGMDPVNMKTMFGRQISFWGGISVQKTLPFGSVRDVRQEVRERINVLGKDGGYVLSSSHDIQHDTPLGNILAMYDEARKGKGL